MRPFLQRLKSRKFLMAFFTALLIVLNEGLDFGVSTEAYGWFSGVVIAWILGESYVDANK